MLQSRPNPTKYVLSVLLVFAAFWTHDAEAARVIQSTSLNPCMDQSMFTATLFNVTFTPDDGTLSIKINGISEISGNVTATLELIAYGYTAFTKKLNPCEMSGFEGMCPMSQGQINLNSDIPVDSSVADVVPGIAYQVPDLDGVARIMVNSTNSGEMLACVQAPLSNGKTVDQHAVSWTTAIIAGMGLVASAVTSGLGHSNTAAHVAANALSLFGYFQSQAILGMTGVKLPPVVSSWTLNYDWSMGIIKVGFMQKIFTWYISATGGKPATLLDDLGDISVEIAKRNIKRGIEKMPYMMTRAAMYGFVELPERSEPSMSSLVARSGIYGRSSGSTDTNSSSSAVKVSGIDRVAFKQNIEATNFFMTGLAFFVAFLVLVCVGVSAFKWISEAAIKMKWMKGSKFLEFRNGWLTVLKGIMYRCVLIGFPQMAVLCLWELTVRDSAGAVVLAVFFFFSMLGILAWASFKVVRIAQRSVMLHKNPAYILYSDPSALNRWGFLYVQFKASAYYYIIPLLLYVLVKAMFVAFGQKNGVVQAIALLLIELGYLIAVSIMRPWMDKRTNIFNISICVLNFLNAIFLMVFSGVFKNPDIVTGVMGVVYFVMNAAFAFVLLVLVLISSIYAIVSKDPDIRYQPMRDDRGSFIKSGSQMSPSTELDALGVTARGDMKTRDLVDDGEPYGRYDASQVPLPPSTATSTRDAPRSPVDPVVPLFPASSHDSRSSYGAGNGQTPGMPLLSASNSQRAPSRSDTRSPASQHSYDYNQYNQNQPRNNNQPINWHSGAGYD